jgi:hypothetical protein
MKADIKERWVAALRSGEYRQAEGYLRTEEGFCCLGVLCELAVQDGVILPAKRTSVMPRDVVSPPHWIYDGTDTKALPYSVMLWAGLHEVDPTVCTSVEADDDIFGRHSNLAELNDSGGVYTFDRLADLIENSLMEELEAQKAAELEQEAVELEQEETHP